MTRHLIVGWSLGLVVLVSAAPARAQRPILAVFDLQDKGGKLSGSDRDNLMEILVAHLAEGGFNIIPRQQLRQRLAQQKKASYRACYDQSCQIALGRELAAQKALSSRVMRIGERCHLTAVLYDLKRATTERAATAEASCDVEALAGAVKAVARKLCQPAGPGSAADEGESDHGGPDASPPSGGAADGHGAQARAPAAKGQPATTRSSTVAPARPAVSPKGPRAADGGKAPGKRVGDVIVKPSPFPRMGRVKLSATRLRFETKKEQRVFTTELVAADGRSYLCPEVRLARGCDLPKVAQGRATLVVRSPKLGTYIRKIEIEDDSEMWIYSLRSWPKGGSVVAWTFGGLALATGAALVPVGFSVDSKGMYIGGFASLAGGAGLLWLGFLFPSNVVAVRDEYDISSAAARRLPRGPRVTLVPGPAGASVVGQF